MHAPRQAIVSHRHLLGLDGMTREALTSLLDRSATLADIARGDAPVLDTLRGRTVANVFFESSTRTRCSFTMAARKLGGMTLDVSGRSSSHTKGESLLDTCRNLRAMGCDIFVVRVEGAGAPRQLAQQLDAPIINAGDGRHEHPTQGLLDLLSIRERFHSIEGRRVVIVGDVVHSRVARSAIFGLTTLGASIALVGPPRLVPRDFERLADIDHRVRVVHDFDAAIEDEPDVVMMLRVQFERAAGHSIASIDEYRERYALTRARAGRLPPDTIIMHPGPINRGLEIDDDVADDEERSVILRQVTNGVAVRMAVLERACAEI